jgi:hypothetical protein
VCKHCRYICIQLYLPKPRLLLQQHSLLSTVPLLAAHTRLRHCSGQPSCVFLLEYKPLNAARECGVTFFSNSSLAQSLSSADEKTRSALSVGRSRIYTIATLLNNGQSVQTLLCCFPMVAFLWLPCATYYCILAETTLFIYHDLVSLSG